MEIVDTTQINSFVSRSQLRAQEQLQEQLQEPSQPLAQLQSQLQEQEPPANETVFILTSSQLKSLIQEAIQKATEPLVDRISSLEATVASQDAKIASLEATQDTLSENQLIQLQLIHKMKEESRQEASAQVTTKKTTDRIDDLHRMMVEDRTQQVSIAKGARLLGLSKERLRQLKPLIMQDGRFELGWSTVKGRKAVVIRIRQFLK